jgi:two-component system alkaline phosphatase synthesis response regulator PhoP
MGKIRKILVADDEDVITEFLKDFLGGIGYKIIVAKDGEETLQQIEKNPDLVLLDVKMPKLSGIEVCKIIKSDENTQHIPVLMFSAKAQLYEQKKGFDAGADAYITKPITFPELVKVIKSYDIEDKDSE